MFRRGRQSSCNGPKTAGGAGYIHELILIFCHGSGIEGGAGQDEGGGRVEAAEALGFARFKPITNYRPKLPSWSDLTQTHDGVDGPKGSTALTPRRSRRHRRWRCLHTSMPGKSSRITHASSAGGGLTKGSTALCSYRQGSTVTHDATARATLSQGSKALQQEPQPSAQAPTTCSCAKGQRHSGTM